jgi:hypothetical protein
MKAKLLAKLHFSVLLVFAVLILALALSIMTALNLWGYTFVWPVVALNFGLLFFLVLNQSPVAPNLLPFLENIFPVISNLRKEIKRRAESSKVIDKMEYAMEFYGLIDQLRSEKRIKNKDGHYVFDPNFRDELLNHMLNDVTSSESMASCAEKIAENMDRPVAEGVLELLYQERDKIHTSLRYHKIKQIPEELLELANILDHCGRLPDRVRLYPEGESPKEETNLNRGYLPNMTEAFPYSNMDIVELLNDRDEFHLDEIERVLDSLREVWGMAVGYLAFLATNYAPKTAVRFGVSDLLCDITSIPAEELPGAGIKSRLDHLDTTLERELYRAGDLSLSAAFPDMDLQTRTSLNLISQILYFTEKRTASSDLKIKICREAAKRDTAVQMALAYLEYKEAQQQDETFDGLTFVNTNYIATHWLETIEKKKQELGPGFDKEISVIQSSLADGIWWTRLPPVVEKTLNIVIEEWRNQFEEIKVLVEKREDAGESIKRIFRSLSLRTIERFLEAKTIVAYLLTFDIQEGSLAKLVDVFRNEEKYEALESFGISMKFNEKPKYAFKEYIKQCRLGIVPPGMTFEDFYRAFQQDLVIAYEHRDELEIVDINNFEIIIHRFGLSGRDRYGFDDFMLEDQRKHALPRIRELFADNLDLKDLIALIGYERKIQNDNREVEAIFEIMMDDTIKDLVLKQVGDLSPSEQKSLEDADLNLKKKLLRRFGQTTVQALARNLLQQSKKQQTACDVIARSIQEIRDRPKSFNNLRRRELIAQTYIGTLVDIAGLFS